MPSKHGGFKHQQRKKALKVSFADPCHLTTSDRFLVFWALRSSLEYRGKMPTRTTWSPDGSLLAVLHESCVTLWDPATNTLRQVLACPEVSSVKHASFVGNHGRYLAVAGEKEWVLWDLIVTTGKSMPHPPRSTYPITVLPSYTPRICRQSYSQHHPSSK